MSTERATSTGELIAKALAGAWRLSPPALVLSPDELERITALLYGGGAGALVWRRLRQTTLQALPAAVALQQAFRLQTLRAARAEREIQRAFQMLRSAEIEALLFKGWAAARLYPEEGLRPWGDLDLYVRPRDHARATNLLQTPGALTCTVDLFHQDLANLDERGVEELFARSRPVALGDAEVSVPCEADHLRLLCLHWLRHHAWRPLWLCDIAAALENRGADFDWDVCLRRGTERQRDWIICALALACRLLGADARDTPVEPLIESLPQRLPRAVLKQWQFPIKYHEPDNLPMLTLLRRRAGLFKALRARWPNAIEATYDARSPFTRIPSAPSQLRLYLARAASFQARLPNLSRGES
jgi:hypothetical protein